MDQGNRAAVIGQPIAHSLSPVLQQAAFAACGITVQYDRIEVAPADLPAFVEQTREPAWIGFNVTVPHKESVRALVDQLAPSAQSVGAVNTVVNDAGRLTGHNTDLAGFLRALREDGGLDPAGADVVVAGAGGAARACVLALIEAKAKSIIVINRDRARAERLTESFGDRRVRVGRADVALPVDLVVNATSVGMAGGPAPDELPLPAAWLQTSPLVYDLVYRPSVTPLLRTAHAAGCQILGGLPMLVYQGAAAFELWTGRPAPVDVMFAALRTVL